MKTHRYTLILSFLIFIISFVLILILSQQDKLFEIILSFFGSSFIAFVVELPNYISLKSENKRKLYYSLAEIKNQILFLKKGIIDQYNYKSINANFFEGYTNKIVENLNTLKLFDPNFYILKNKNLKAVSLINSINNSYSNLNLSILNFSISVTKKNNNLDLQNTITSVIASEVNIELDLITRMCDDLILILDEAADILLNKKQKIEWTINNQTTKNFINSLIF